MITPADRGGSRRAISRIECLLLLLIAVAYAVPVVMCWNQGYLDFGDGNYMYISWRLSQGAVLYKDILAPQPPLHLYIGAVIAWIGERIFPHPLWAFRTFSLLLHIATMVLVWFTARSLFVPRIGAAAVTSRAVPMAAALTYMVQPVGFWWTLGYQSQPLLIILLLGMFCCVIRNTRRGAWWGGLWGGLALLTNMTTVPYVAFTIGWMLWRRFRRGVAFTIAALLPSAIVIPVMQFYTGAYISNVFENQAGAFPRAEVLAQSGETIADYVIRKIVTEGGDVLRLEGTWVALAALGLLVYGGTARAGGRLTAARSKIESAPGTDEIPMMETPAGSARLADRSIVQTREYALYYAFFSFCCILFVAKGGTVDYVFSDAEPYVALFAAPVIVWAGMFARRLWGRGPRWNDLSPLCTVFIAVVLALSVAWPGLRFIYLTLRQETYELPEKGTLRIVGLIKQRTAPDDLIIAPPHFAFIAQRRILDDYSEHFLWRIKYMNERLDGIDGRAVRTVEHMAQVLREKKLPFLVMDMNQTGALPEIADALKSSYRPLRDKPLQMLNTPLQFYAPKE